MRKTLEDFYYGNIAPHEQTMTPSSELRLAVDRVTHYEKQLEELRGVTKLIIAQRVSSVEHADRIIVMNEGQINGFGTHEELLAENEIYRDVYESQTGGSGDFDEK